MKNSENRNSKGSKLHATRGTITVFFALLTSLLLLTTALTFDFARVDIARADARGALQLSSHLALSQYDEKLLQEYGLLAIRDWDAARALAQQAMEENIGGGGFVGQKLKQLELTPAPQETLSHPAVLEAQIIGTMRRRFPKIVLDGILTRLNSFHEMSAFAPVLRAKVTYEEKKKDIQRATEQFGWFFEGALRHESAAEDAGGELALWEGNESLDTQAEQVNEILQRGADCLHAGKEAEARALFTQAKNDYHKISDRLERRKESAEQTAQLLAGFTEAQHGLENAYDAWGAAFSNTPAGSARQALQGDYFAAQPEFSGDAYARFQEELTQIGQISAQQKESWEQARQGAQRFEETGYDDWAKLVQETDVQPLQIADNRKLSYTFSPEFIAWQKRILQSSQQKRRGLGEFIEAWNARRQARARLKEAQREHYPNLPGHIRELGLSTEVLERFRQAGMASHGSAAVPAVVGEDPKTAFSAMEQTHENLSGLSALGGSGGGTLQDGVLLAYWNGVFTHRLSARRAADGKPDISIFGMPRLSRTSAGFELEYICEGDVVPQENLRRIVWKIAGLRLVANGIYAFSSSELRAQTAGLACMLAGWTGFGVPIVQSGLLLLLASGETALDVHDLTEGKAVPIYKTPTTWRFGLAGVRDLAADAVSDLFGRVEDEVIAGVEAAQEMGTETVTQMQEGLTRAAVDSIRVPLQQLGLETLLSDQKVEPEDIARRLDRLFETLPTGEGDGGALRAQLLARVREQKSDFVEIFQQAREDRAQAGLETSDVFQGMQDTLDRTLQPLTDCAAQTITGWSQALCTKIQGLRGRAEAAAQEEIRHAFQNFQGQLSGSSSSLPGTGEAASGLAMNYEDYLLALLFLQMQLPGERDRMLVRTAQLIQTQLDGTDLTTAPTAVDWIAHTLPETTFFNGEGLRAPLFPIITEWHEGYLPLPQGARR